MKKRHVWSVVVGMMLASALCMAQDAPPAGGGGAGAAGGNGGGAGGGRPGGGRGNFDPAAAQQRRLDNVKERLAFSDTEWAAVQPLVQKVMEFRRESMVGMGGFGRRGGNAGGNTAAATDAQPPRGGAFGQPSPEAEALQKAIDASAPADQIKAALEKFRAAHKASEAKLLEAQENLRKVLSVKQEAQAALLGLVN